MASAARALTGKVALVTGATGAARHLAGGQKLTGIGVGIAGRLAAAGADIVITGLGDTRENIAFAESLAVQHSVKAHFLEANLANTHECAELVGQTKSLTGRCDILVNNAGFQYVAPTEEFPEDKWNLLMAVNLTAPFFLIKAALPIMRENGFGRIVNIASTHGLVGSANKAPYVASKHGVVGMTKAIALETATENITVNAICPGWVRTPLVEDQIEALAQREGLDITAAAKALLEEKQPSLQFATAEQVGAYVNFLCSEDAAQVTGSVQTIDGGWVAR